MTPGAAAGIDSDLISSLTQDLSSLGDTGQKIEAELKAKPQKALQRIAGRIAQLKASRGAPVARKPKPEARKAR
jgi:hypothetical protein